LHAPDRGQVKTPFLRVEGSHRARTVDADQPVGLGAALRSVGEGQQLAIGPQAIETLADGGGRHRLQPQALDRLFRARVLDDVAENEFTLAARVAGVDEAGNVFSLEQPQQQVQPALAALDRREREMRRNYRQVRE